MEPTSNKQWLLFALLVMPNKTAGNPGLESCGGCFWVIRLEYELWWMMLRIAIP